MRIFPDIIVFKLANWGSYIYVLALEGTSSCSPQNVLHKPTSSDDDTTDIYTLAREDVGGPMECTALLREDSNVNYK